MKINRNRLFQSIMEMAKIGATPNGGSCRLALTDQDKKGRELFIKWCKEIQCAVSVGLHLKKDEKTKIYMTKNRYNCGPCSFINLTAIHGNRNVERELAQIGRVKPFKISLASSFLLWAAHYNKDLYVYTNTKTLNKKCLQMIFQVEKIPLNRQLKAETIVQNHLRQIYQKYIRYVRRLDDPLRRLDQLLDKGYRVAVLISSYYMGGSYHTPHWIVAFKKVKNHYYFMDSSQADGITRLTSRQILKGFKLNMKNGFPPQMVSYT